MIVIRKPEIVYIEDKARLRATVLVDASEYELWYQVESRFASGLCADRGDAFVAGLLYYAMVRRHDIVSEAPLTWEFKDGVEHNFLDVVCEQLPGERPYHVKITSEVVDSLHKDRQSCATGISCGVDSLYSVKRRLLDSDAKLCCDRYLVLNDIHGSVVEDTPEKHEYRWKRLLRRASSFAREVGIPLIIGETNYNADAIPGLSFEFSTSFGNLFCILSMQGLYTSYYLASGGSLENLVGCIRGGILSMDPDDFDVLTLSAMSSRSLRLVSDGQMTRIAKLATLIDWDLAQKYLDVCHVHSPGNDMNGTFDCPKCMHTVIELMALGALDKFDRVFDVNYVKSNREEFLAEFIRRRLLHVPTAMETWPLRGKIGFTSWEYVRASIIVFLKLVRKILRRGAISSAFSPR